MPRTYGGKPLDEITPQDATGLPARDAAALVTDIRPRLRSIHQDDSGELRDKTPDEQAEFQRLLDVLDAAELHLKIHGAMGNPRAVVRGDGAGFGGGETADRRGWVTAPGSNPALEGFRSAAMATLERAHGDGVLGSHAADVVDGVLRRGDPHAVTARYTAAVGNDDYSSAFGKMLADPQMGTCGSARPRSTRCGRPRRRWPLGRRGPL